MRACVCVCMLEVRQEEGEKEWVSGLVGCFFSVSAANDVTRGSVKINMRQVFCSVII